ncbi:MAG: glutamate synthase, partial [Eubacteriales bacterium]|nr:glutamate synthase [Eubacteriales bacterium]
MMLDANSLTGKELCEAIRQDQSEVLELENVNGQRYLAVGCGKKKIILHGTPGNALGADLDGA